MKTPIPVVVLTSLSGCLLLITLAIAIPVVLGNHGLRADLVAAEARSASDRQLLLAAEEARQQLENALAAEHKRVAALRSEVTSLQKSLAPVKGTPVERHAVRTRVYAGQQSLGHGWLISGGDQGGEGSEPVVILDVGVLQTLAQAVVRTTAPAEIPRQVTVNNHYPSYTPASTWGYPIYWRPSIPHGTNRPPSGIAPPQPPVTLPPPQIQTGTRDGVWKPSGKPFLPSPSPWPIVTPPSSRGGFSAPSRPMPVSRPVSRPAVAPRAPAVQISRQQVIR